MKQNWILDPDLKQITLPDERFYEHTDPETGQVYVYPSTTHVLNIYPKGAGFVQWLKDVGNNAKMILDRAAESGNKVHHAIERLLDGGTLSWDGENYDVDEWRGIMRFVDFYERTDLNPDKILATEIKTFSFEYGYAGTIDLVCEIDGEIWLIDFKFGNSIWPTYFQQVVAYKTAFEQTQALTSHPVTVDRVGVLHLKANVRTHKRPTEKRPDVNWQGPGWQLVDPINDSKTKQLATLYQLHPYQVIWDNWERTLGIWYYENPNPKPSTSTYPTEIVLDKDLADPAEAEPDGPVTPPETPTANVGDPVGEVVQKSLDLS